LADLLRRPGFWERLPDLLRFRLDPRQGGERRDGVGYRGLCGARRFRDRRTPPGLVWHRRGGGGFRWGGGGGYAGDQGRGRRIPRLRPDRLFLLSRRDRQGFILGLGRPLGNGRQGSRGRGGQDQDIQGPAEGRRGLDGLETPGQDQQDMNEDGQQQGRPKGIEPARSRLNEGRGVAAGCQRHIPVHGPGIPGPPGVSGGSSMTSA
jgi:hypothetical protein